MADKKRIWAAHAISETYAAISVGELEDDDPFSAILLFNEQSERGWGFVDIPRTIVSITDFVNGAGKSIFVVMSNEGDVYFIDEGIPLEKIPGAGVLSDDAEGRGSMRTIRNLNGVLYACGNGSQVYRRDGPDRWTQIGSPEQLNGDVSDFVGIGLTAAGSLVVCGQMDVRYSAPTKKEEELLARVKAEGPNSRYLELLDEIVQVVQLAHGCLYVQKNGRWIMLETPSDRDLNDVAALSGDGFVCVGNGGTILSGSGPDQIVDVSIAGLMEPFHKVRTNGDATYVLGDSAVFALDRKFDLIRTIDLPQRLKDPNIFALAGETIWYFDHRGMARYRGDAWEIIKIPADLWARDGS